MGLVGVRNREIYTTGGVTHFFGDSALAIDTNGWCRVTHTHIFICADPDIGLVPSDYRFTFNPDTDGDFNEGDSAVYGGIRTRIEKGNKAPGDLTWNVYTEDETRVSFGYVVNAVKAICAIEDRIYPRFKGFKGNKKFLERLDDVRAHGWRYAKKLNDEEIRWSGR